MHSDNRNMEMLMGRGIASLPMPPGDPALQTSGRTLGRVAGVYDLIEPAMMFGLDRVIRREVVDLLSLQGGERILPAGAFREIVVLEKIAEQTAMFGHQSIGDVDNFVEELLVGQPGSPQLHLLLDITAKDGGDHEAILAGGLGVHQGASRLELMQRGFMRRQLEHPARPNTDPEDEGGGKTHGDSGGG